MDNETISISEANGFLKAINHVMSLEIDTKTKLELSEKLLDEYIKRYVKS